MKERILWIDWVKVVGITIVIFCHVPQVVPPTVELSFLKQIQMPLMFMISGILYKRPFSCDKTGICRQWLKYWHQLALPAILFCLIGWPYYIIREYVDSGGFSFYVSFVQPVVSALTLQTPTNGVFWYVMALLEMKIVMDLCQCTKKPNISISIIAISGMVVLFFLREVYVGEFQFSGFLAYWPMFVIGFLGKPFLMKLGKAPLSLILVCAIFFFAFSLSCVLFPVDFGLSSIGLVVEFVWWKLLMRALGALSIIMMCMGLRRTYSWVETASRGTIVTLGLHFMMIGTLNQIVKILSGIHGEIQYSTPVSIVITLFLSVVCYGCILVCRKHFPILLGNR